jgi:hypothetical protein
MPNLGIIASQITGHLNNNAYESIATVTVGSGGTSTISFTSITSTYKHLQVRASLNSGGDIECLVNSDSGANYNRHYIIGDGSTASASYQTSYGLLPAYVATGKDGNFIQDFLDYTNTNKYKTTRSLSGYEANGSGYVLFSSGLWRSTSAITSITFNSKAGNMSQYSSFALYGVKG